MSALGHKRTFAAHKRVSARGEKADIARGGNMRDSKISHHAHRPPEELVCRLLSGIAKRPIERLNGLTHCTRRVELDGHQLFILVKSVQQACCGSVALAHHGCAACQHGICAIARSGGIGTPQWLLGLRDFQFRFHKGETVDVSFVTNLRLPITQNYDCYTICA
jgi:hypothetical protein